MRLLRRRFHFTVLLLLQSHCLGRDFPLEQWNAWSQHSDDRYPGKTWLQYAAPEEAGWSSDKLQQAHSYYDSLDASAVMVIHDGIVLVAWGEVDRRFPCHSIRKSLLSALFGVHVSKGDIDLNKTLSELSIDDDPPLTILVVADRRRAFPTAGDVFGSRLWRSRSGCPAARQSGVGSSCGHLLGLDVPLGRDKKRVETSERFKLLSLILDARIQMRRSLTPHLLPMHKPRPRIDAVTLSPETLEKYVGDYEFDGFALTVSRAADGFLIGTLRIGQFSLLPKSETEFDVEDFDAAVTFELDSDGAPFRIIGTFAPGKTLEGRRLQLAK